MREPTTFIKLDRNITEWRWYQDANTFRVFVHLLLKANIADHDFQNETIRRGDVATSYASIADALGISVKCVRTALTHLKDTGEVAIKRHSKYSVISILRYDSYQGYRADKGQSTGNQRAIKGQQSKNNKNDKKERTHTVCEDSDLSWWQDMAKQLGGGEDEAGGN